MVTITFNCNNKAEKDALVNTLTNKLNGWLPAVNSEVKIQNGERDYCFELVLNPLKDNDTFGFSTNVDMIPTDIDFSNKMNPPVELIHMTYKEIKNLIRDYLVREQVTTMSEIDKQLYKYATACPEHIRKLYPNKWLQAYETMATLGYFGANAPHLCETDLDIEET